MAACELLLYLWLCYDQVEVGSLEPALDINDQTAHASIEASAGSNLEHLAMTATIEQQSMLEVNFCC